MGRSVRDERILIEKYHVVMAIDTFGAFMTNRAINS